MTVWNKKWGYKTCMEESKKYKTRSEFQKGNRSAYNVARKNGWLDEYTWLKRQYHDKWTYETCMKESKKYMSRGEFSNGCSRAYEVARKNGWLNDYTWLESKFHADWTYENCMEESKKYKSRSEFCKGNGSAYNVACKNGWLDEYTWFKRLVKPNGYWDYERCMEESKKYISRGEFSNGSSRAYEVARKNGWLDDFTWLELKFHADWTYETCMEESRNYTTRSEFCKGNGSAYNVARENGWLDEYTWLKDERFDLYKDNIDSVYVYEFKEFNCAYVGRTLMRCKRKRDIAHIFHTDNDAVAKFAKEHNISVPEPIYLEENLTLEDGAKQEEYWFNKYKEDGWTMLNSAKTGSIGALGKGKWNKKTCMEESKKYMSRGEFQKGNSRAYNVARENGWLDDFFPKCNDLAMACVGGDKENGR